MPPREEANDDDDEIEFVDVPEKAGGKAEKAKEVVVRSLPPLSKFATTSLGTELQKATDAATRVLSLSCRPSILADIRRAGIAEWENTLSGYDQLEVLQFMQARRPLRDAIETIAQAYPLLDGATSSIDPRDTFLYAQDAEVAHDISEVTTVETRGIGILNEQWPTILGCTKRIVQCAPDAHDFVRSFYSRLGNPDNKQAHLEFLFKQEFVTFANKVCEGMKIPYENVKRIENVSARIAYLSNCLHLYTDFVCDVGSELHVALEDKVVEKGLIRCAVILIVGYGIKTLAPQRPVVTADILPGWRSDGVDINYELKDAFEQYPHLAYVIAPCRIRRRVAELQYFNNMIKCTSASRHEIDQVVDAINAWTWFVCIEDANWLNITRVVRALADRAAWPSQVEVRSDSLQSIPLILGDQDIRMHILFLACPNIILGPRSITEPTCCENIVVKRCPLEYLVREHDSFLGARINARSSIIVDADYNPRLVGLPKFIRERVRTSNLVSAHLHQAVLHGTLSDTDDDVQLLTLYAHVTHLMTAFPACDFSPLRRRSCDACREFASKNSRTITECDPETCPIARYPSPEEPRMCEKCAEFTEVNKFGGLVKKTYPYCAGGCPNRRRKQIACDDASHVRGRCTSCGGKYMAIARRFVLNVNPDKAESVARLGVFVHIFRLLRCEVSIILRLSVDAIPEDKGYLQVLVQRLAVIAAFFLDIEHFPRIRIQETGKNAALPMRRNVTSTYQDTVLSIADAPRLMTRLHNGVVIVPEWRLEIPKYIESIHAVVLSMIMRVEGNDNRIYSVDEFVVFIVENHYRCIASADYDVFQKPRTTEHVVEAVRMILSHLDQIGLIKFCADFDLVFVTMAYFSEILVYMTGQRKDDCNVFELLGEQQRFAGRMREHIVKLYSMQALFSFREIFDDVTNELSPPGSAESRIKDTPFKRPIFLKTPEGGKKGDGAKKKKSMKPESDPRDISPRLSDDIDGLEKAGASMIRRLSQLKWEEQTRILAWESAQKQSQLKSQREWEKQEKERKEEEKASKKADDGIQRRSRQKMKEFMQVNGNGEESQKKLLAWALENAQRLLDDDARHPHDPEDVPSDIDRRKWRQSLQVYGNIARLAREELKVLSGGGLARAIPAIRDDAGADDDDDVDDVKPSVLEEKSGSKKGDYKKKKK
jgi:hypothetical protein